MLTWEKKNSEFYLNVTTISNHTQEYIPFCQLLMNKNNITDIISKLSIESSPPPIVTDQYYDLNQL